MRGVGSRRDAGEDEVTKLGDDLIRSLKEAVAHAKGEGPGTKHEPMHPPHSEADNTRPLAEDDANGVH